MTDHSSGVTKVQAKIERIQKIVVLASGSGTNFEALVKACKMGSLNKKAQIVGLIVDKPNVGAVEKSKILGVPYEVCSNKGLDYKQWDKKLSLVLSKFSPDLVVLAGFIKKIGPEVLKITSSIINTHPSLLPKYGGPGMYGMNVHKAVVESNDKESGVSIHWVNEKFDDGLLIAQKKVLLDKNETAESLMVKIKEIENEFLVKVVGQVL